MIKNIVSAFILISLLVSCGGEKKVEGWVINGTIDAIKDGELRLRSTSIDEDPITYPIKDGKFTVKGDAVSEPTFMIFLPQSEDVHINSAIEIFVENGVTNYSATTTKADYQFDGKKTLVIKDYTVDGSVANKHHKEFMKQRDALVESMTREEYQQRFEKEYEQMCMDFIKNNPAAYYSSHLIYLNSNGISRERGEELLAMVSPNLKSKYIDDLKKKVEAKSKDVKYSDIISASDVSYSLDGKFDGSSYKDAKYLGLLSNNNIVALNNNKTVTIIDGSGKQVKSFPISDKAIPSTMAIDEKDNIFVLTPEEKEVEQNFRGKITKKKETIGYFCNIYNSNGKEIGSYKLADVKLATGARAIDGKLIVADAGSRNINIFNATTGISEAVIKDMRSCCNILDFDINDKNELLVANLGAFRVQKYDMSGKQILSFGARGTAADQFHGCCNPVSLAYLSNGAIVTVEKSPTRVKVFSKEGAKVIAGIDEMVEGCVYIPMTVDSKDNLYLASPKKGIVRCVAI